jgi:acetyl-CoA carboxylase biotin carboxylase subunit
MRLVRAGNELAAAWRDAASEAQNAFGDSRLYLEKYLAHARHIEIQALADHHGNVVYLGERECSVQRRHQKVIEEAPSPVVDETLRRAMGESAVRLARAGGYTNAGTLEFMVDEARNFYFLEMNTRLQVEHPVTEMVTGLDLVKLQIRIAAGEPLPFKQEEIALRGHAIECRVYAEDPDNNFFPSPGRILSRRIPAGPGIRMDDGVYPGWVVPNDYDPLLGKLIAYAATREEAIERMRRALEEYYVSGIKTNIALFRRILREQDFLSARLHTRWLDEWLSTAPRPAAKATGNGRAEDAAVLAAALWHLNENSGAKIPPQNGAPESRWKLEGRREQLDRTRR